MRLSWPEIRANAARFSEEWAGKGYEKGQTQSFYDEFFAVFGVPRKQVAVYEQRVKALDATRTGGFIDLFWPGTLIVEQKSSGRDLTRAMSQALDYYSWLPEVQQPRYMMVCDFQRFELVDLETREEFKFALADLKLNVEVFGFIMGVQPRIFRNQSPVNKAASELMGQLHRALADDGYTGHNLERLLVRLLFILFADDTGIFERKDMFLTWLEQQTRPDGRDLGEKLGMLFQVLDTAPERRQRGLDDDLAEFPYINGELFRERIDMPSFTNAMRTMLIDASMFNWGEVSPAIFGSLFESVIDKVSRRKQGAHYTPEEAILKVIGPLFLDELREEFDSIKLMKSGRDQALAKFHNTLAGLTFLDPACGAGNFLVVAYRELRELEREVIKLRYSRPGMAKSDYHIDVARLTRLNVDKFFGIEIDEFPALIAQVALWMTDHIANTGLAEDFGQAYARIPLVTSPGIVHGDALEKDWSAIVPHERCTHILGNPPFIGFVMRGEKQQLQFTSLMKEAGVGGSRVDYVAAWFIKAAQFIRREDCTAKVGLVATSSICQGEQVEQLWPAIWRLGAEIDFAHQAFAWPGQATVHCIVVGLTSASTLRKKRRLFSYGSLRSHADETNPEAISPYLAPVTKDASHIVVERTGQPLRGQPRIKVGTKPVEGGHYILDANERAEMLSQRPLVAKILHPFIGTQEFVSGSQRWLLNPAEASASDLRAMPEVAERISAVRKYRKNGGPLALSLAGVPMEFHVTVKPTRPFLAIPEVSTERREYIPIGWLKPPVIPSNKLLVMLDADLFSFAVVTSRMHMSWVRTVTGRLGNGIQYSPGLVYNTFPWPDATSAQRVRVEALAQAVLDARGLPKNAASSLADLYDPDFMPKELRAAHKAVDVAVDRLYSRAPFGSDRERVEHLFGLYQRLVDPLGKEGVRQNKRVARKRGLVA